MGSTIARRQFVAGTAMLSAGAALAPAAFAEEVPASAPASAEIVGIPSTETFEGLGYGEPPSGPVAFVAEPIAEGDIVKTVDTEVLIIGGGLSGACTAVSLNEYGVANVVLEKGSQFNGRGGDICAWGDAAHLANGTQNDPDELIKALMDMGEWRVDYGIMRTWADNCNEAFDWLAALVEPALGEAYVVWDEPYVQMVDTRWYGTASHFVGGNAALLPVLQELAEKGGSDIYLDTPAVQLVKEGNAVVGAIAQTEEGYVRFNASKGVVLATGGYECNPDMIKRCIKPRDGSVDVWLGMTNTNTGDGHLMGEAVGGLMDELPHCMMTSSTSYIGMLRVNSSGMRFAPEYISATLLINCIQNQINGYDWIIADANALATLEKTRGSYSMPGTTAEGQYQDMLDRGVTADTIEELADKMGVPQDIFVATIERYNELCEKGVDDDFNCPDFCLNAIKEPPFVAMREGISNLTSVNGLRITPKSEVLSAETKRPIPGLYALGNVSGGMFAGSYAHNVSGVSHSRCITFGRLLGQRLAGAIE